MFAKIRSWFAKSETKCAESSSIDSNEIVNTMVAEHVDRFFENVAYHICCSDMIEFCYNKNISKHMLFKAIRLSDDQFEGSFAQHVKDLTMTVNWSQRKRSFEQIDHLMRLFTRDQFVEKKREIEALLNDKQKSAELAKTAIDFVITNRDQCSYPWHQTEI